eukprot:2488046-Prorocentrum_lima.AAC.1
MRKTKQDPRHPLPVAGFRAKRKGDECLCLAEGLNGGGFVRFWQREHTLVEHQTSVGQSKP